MKRPEHESCRHPGWKLVVSDMDGTLLDKNSLISPENARAIKALHEHGIAFTVATGRMDRMARAYIRQLEIRLPVIACNGAVIRDCVTDDILWRRNLPPEEALDLISWLREQGFDYLCYTPDDVYFPQHSQRVALFHRYNQIAGEQVADRVPLHLLDGREAEVVKTGLIKILAVPHDAASLAAIRGRTARLAGLAGVASMEDAFDIMASGVSKGDALTRLAGFQGLDMSEVVTLGDNDNDADMLAAAGLGIAMANGTPLALTAGRLVTKSDHDHAGLAEAVWQHILQCK